MKDKLFAFLALNGPTVGVIALIIVAVFLVTGCNTIAGMGTDITRSAEWTKDKMSGGKESQSQGDKK